VEGHFVEEDVLYRSTFCIGVRFVEECVPDRRCRIVPEVVLVRRGVNGVLGIWKGEGWVKGGQFTSNLRPRWMDPVTARRVPSK
jgi:hypothetical protein